MKQRRIKNTPAQRAAFLDQLLEAVESGDLSNNEAIKSLRVDLLRVDQATFAKIGLLSVRRLWDIESGSANPTLATINGLLGPFGLRLGLDRKRPVERQLVVSVGKATCSPSVSAAHSESRGRSRRSPGRRRGDSPHEPRARRCRSCRLG